MHGNIYEIELLKDYGYGYVQTLFTSEFGLESHVLIRTISYFSKEQFNGSVVDFDKEDELVYPSISLVMPKTRGANKWRLLGSLPVYEDYQVPKFKADFTTKSWDTSDWDRISWFVITNLVPNGLDGGYEYQQVKHLPFWRHCTPSVFKIKLTMFWIKKHGLDIRAFFKLSEEYNYSMMYNEVINSVFYSEIDSRYLPVLKV